MKLLRIKLPDSLHARLKVQCAVDAVSMQEAGVEALAEWISERGLANAQTQNNPRSNVQNERAR